MPADAPEFQNAQITPDRPPAADLSLPENRNQISSAQPPERSIATNEPNVDQIASASMIDYFRANTNNLGKLVAQLEASPWVWAHDNSPLRLADIQHHLSTPESIRRNRNRSCIQIGCTSRVQEKPTLELKEDQEEAERVHLNFSNKNVIEEKYGRDAVVPRKEGYEGDIGGSGTIEKNIMRSNSSTGATHTNLYEKRRNSKLPTRIYVNDEIVVSKHHYQEQLEHSSAVSATLSELSVFQPSVPQSPCTHINTKQATLINETPRRSSIHLSPLRTDCSKNELKFQASDMQVQLHHNDMRHQGNLKGIHDYESVSLTYTHTDESPTSRQTCSTATIDQHENIYSEKSSRCPSLSETSEAASDQLRKKRSDTTSPATSHNSHNKYWESHKYPVHHDPSMAEQQSPTCSNSDCFLKDATSEQLLACSYGEGDTQWSVYARKSSHSNDRSIEARILNAYNELPISRSSIISSESKSVRHCLPTFPESLRTLKIELVGMDRGRRYTGSQRLAKGDHGCRNHRYFQDFSRNSGKSLSIHQSDDSSRDCYFQYNGTNNGYCETPTRKTPTSSTPASSNEQSSSVAAEVAKWRRICRKEHKSNFLSNNNRFPVSCMSVSNPSHYLPDCKPKCTPLIHDRFSRNQNRSIFGHAISEQLQQPDGLTPPSSSSAITQTEYQCLMKKNYDASSSSLAQSNGTIESGTIHSQNSPVSTIKNGLGVSGHFGTIEELDQAHLRCNAEYATPVPTREEDNQYPTRTQLSQAHNDQNLHFSKDHESPLTDSRSVNATKATSCSCESGTLRYDKKMTSSCSACTYHSCSSSILYTDQSSIIPSVHHSGALCSVQPSPPRSIPSGSTKQDFHQVANPSFTSIRCSPSSNAVNECYLKTLQIENLSEWSFASGRNRNNDLIGLVGGHKIDREEKKKEQSVSAVEEVKETGKDKGKKEITTMEKTKKLEKEEEEEINHKKRKAKSESDEKKRRHRVKWIKDKFKEKHKPFWMKMTRSISLNDYRRRLKRSEDSVSPDESTNAAETQKKQLLHEDFFRSHGTSNRSNEDETIGTIWARLHHRLQENGISSDGIPIIDRDISNVYEIPLVEKNKKNNCKGGSYYVGLSESDIIEMHLSNIDIIKSIQLWDRTIEELQRYKRHCGRLHEYEGSHIRIFQKYDEITTENTKLKEKICSFSRLLNDHTSVASKLYNLSSKQQQLEFEKSQIQKELNEERQKSKLFVVQKRQKDAKIRNLEDQVKRFIDKEGRLKIRAKETLQKYNREKALRRPAIPSNDSSSSGTLRNDYRQCVTAKDALPRVANIRAHSSTCSTEAKKESIKSAAVAPPQDELLTLILHFEQQIEELVNEKKLLQTKPQHQRMSSFINAPTAPQEIGSSATISDETTTMTDRPLEIPCNKDGSALMETATTLATTATLGGFMRTRTTESSSATPQGPILLPATINGAEQLDSNAIKFYLCDLHKQLKTAVEEKTRMQVKFENEVIALKETIRALQPVDKSMSSSMTAQLAASQSHLNDHRPEEYCLSVAADQMKTATMEEDNCNNTESDILKCCNFALKNTTVIKDSLMSTKEMIQRDRDLHSAGFLERLNSLTPSQLYNIVRGSAQKIGLKDPSKLIEVTERLGMAVVQIAHLQKIVKRVAELTGVHGCDRYDDIERIIKNWRTTILNLSDPVGLRQSVVSFLIQGIAHHNHRLYEAIQNAIKSSFSSTIIDHAENSESVIAMQNQIRQADESKLSTVLNFIVEEFDQEVISEKQSDPKKDINRLSSIVLRFMKEFRVPRIELCDAAIEKLQKKTKEHTRVYREITSTLGFQPNVAPTEIIKRIEQLGQQQYSSTSHLCLPSDVKAVLQIFSYFRMRLGLPPPPLGRHTDQFFHRNGSKRTDSQGVMDDSQCGLLLSRSSSTSSSPAASLSFECSLISIDNDDNNSRDGKMNVKWETWGNACLYKADKIAELLTKMYQQQHGSNIRNRFDLKRRSSLMDYE